MNPETRLITDRQWPALEHTVLVRERLEEQYQDFGHQNETASLGMWLFLATEIMFFGALLCGWSVYRYLYSETFEIMSGRLNWQIATLNTVVLLVSSFSMALAVAYVRMDRQRAVVNCLVLTALLGVGFLGLKAYEYYDDYEQGLILGTHFNAGGWVEAEQLSREQIPQAKLFLLFYWLMTALHGLHVIIGISVILVIALLAHWGRFDAHYYGPIEVTGLYWHFVDLVWIFLFPLLYLQSTHHW